MKSIKLVAVFVFVLLLQIVQANEYSQIGLPVSKVFDMKEHGGSGQNWALTQARNGLIYVGTGTGITEWDGEQWQYYATPNRTRIRAIAQWQDQGLYVGTIDDLGVYLADDYGRLTYRSLIADWTPEQHQFGEIWSVAANKQGVAFISNQHVYFWDGKQVTIIADAPGGRHRIFALDEGFVYKAANDPSLYKIQIDISSTQPKFTIQRTQLTLPSTAYMRQIFYNHQAKLVVVTTKHGIYQFGAKQLQAVVSPEQLANGPIYNAIQASDGYYYLASLYDGLFILDKSFKVVRHYKEHQNIGTNKLYAVLEDQQGSIWLSGIPSIIKLYPAHRYSTFVLGDSSTIIDKLAIVNNQLMAAGDGLFSLEKATLLDNSPKFSSVIESKEINFDILEYQGFTLYAGDSGVFVREIGKPDEEFSNILATDWARSLQVDPVTNTLFVSTYVGLFHIELKNGLWSTQFVAATKDELEFVAIDDKGVVWAGTATQELYRVENAQFENKQTKVDKFGGQDGLAPGNVMPFKLSSGVVIGTSDGLMDYQQNRHPKLQMVSEFPPLFTTKGQDVFRLYEDLNGRIWYRIGQATGYIKQDKKGQWKIHDVLFKPFLDGGFNDFLSTSNNTLWFAQRSGEVYRVAIDLAETLPSPGQLHIRQVLNLDSQKVMYGGLLANARLPELQQDNNSIRIKYALSDKHILHATHYRHRLLGSGHDNWSEWSEANVKDYTLLPGGDFQFQLEARDPWQRVYTTELHFSVKPLWYLSTLAWVVYAIILLILLALSGWLTQRWRTATLLHQNILLEKTVSQRTLEIKSKVDELEQQQVLKERFFSNVSHEFRTPLTLTIAPLQSLLQENPTLEKSLASPVATALRNATKMLDLVGHILDINRLNVGQFPLRIVQHDVAELVSQIVLRFENWAKQQGQTLTVENCANPIVLFFDRDQLDKCIANLLSNAIKYSGRHSHITIRLIEHSEQVGIEVIDNGIGIEADIQDQVFERYYQGVHSEQVSQPGTGIGLALVKELIELHHGQVSLNSEAGGGCSFTLWLQRGTAHFDSAQLVEDIVIESPSSLPIELPQPLGTTEPPGTSEEQDITTVLVVDDNIELRQFISLKLSGYYRIIQACDGEEGLAKAILLLPDLIISDVMMPKMNGLKMLSELKKNALTSIIPVVLLTAKSGKRDTVEGLQTGADDYVSKPFDTSELVARISGLINSRKMIRSKIEAEFLLPELAIENGLTFTEKLEKEIVRNLTNPEFNIDVLAQALALSRRSLNRKCQEECQQTVGQFITKIRMQTALKLLKEKQLSISDVAYGTGFESLSYFSRTFKKFYGKAPSSIE
jgi:signal transduction histidine kinase/DNA-binding response OmpR family regulator/ligand-binding sensor domain-containing protein